MIPDPTSFGVTLEEVQGVTAMPVPAFLVVHPNGTLLWDTGLGDQPGVTATSRESLEAFLTTMRAQLWIQHDMTRWTTLKKAPDYYQ